VPPRRRHGGDGFFDGSLSTKSGGAVYDTILSLIIQCGGAKQYYTYQRTHRACSIAWLPASQARTVQGRYAIW
jgi:hypothetical protein